MVKPSLSRSSDRSKLLEIYPFFYRVNSSTSFLPSRYLPSSILEYILGLLTFKILTLQTKRECVMYFYLIYPVYLTIMGFKYQLFWSWYGF